MGKTDSQRDILIGGKPFMSYVMKVISYFKNKDFIEVTIKSRGKFISKAVDVAEVVKKRYAESHKLEIGNIKIGSEEFQNKEQKNICVSTLEITIKKQS